MKTKTKNTINTKKIFYVWTRNKGLIQIRKVLKKRGESVEIYGIFLGQGNQKSDINIDIKHMAPDAKSRIIVRGIVQDNSKIRFCGTISIRKGARNSDAFLDVKAITLSKNSSCTLEPRLEIDENDVRAAHSSRVGPLDENEVFYLCSRGINEQAAKRLLINGFLTCLSVNFPPRLRKQIVLV